MWKSREKRNSYSRQRMKAQWDRWRSIECCGRCGIPCKPYALCMKHRIYVSKVSRKYHIKHRKMILERHRTQSERKNNS